MLQLTGAVMALLFEGTRVVVAQGVRVPATERFDTCTPPALPAGWSATRARYPSVSDFVTTASVPLSPPNAVVATDATVGQALISPPVDISGRGDVTVSFSIRRSSSFTASVILEVSADGGSSYTQGVGDTLHAGGAGTYMPVSCRFPRNAAMVDTLQFRWRILPDSSGSSGTLRLDDVRFDAAALYDLVLDSVLVDLRCEEDTPFTVAVRVRNAGVLAVGAFEVTVVADVDGDSQADAEEPAGNWQGGGLFPGSEMTIRTGLPPLRAGRTRLLATVYSPADQDSTNNTRLSVVDVAHARGSVAINEIMYAPPSGEPEWVELLSLRRDTVDLQGWSVTDSDPIGRKIITQNVICGAGEFLILTRDSLALRNARALPGRIVQVAGFPVLNNAGDAFVLYDQSGTVVDSTRYDPSMGGSEGGVSLERRDPAGFPRDPGNWSSSRDTLGATPGSANSIAMLDHDLQCDGPSSLTCPPGRGADIMLVVRNTGRLPSMPTAIELYEDTNADSIPDPEELVSTGSMTATLLRGESLSVVLRIDAPVAGRHHLIGWVRYQCDQRPEDNFHGFILDVGYLAGSVMVNEVMYNPLTAGAEYVELVNTTLYPIDLSGWTVSDDSENGEAGAVVGPHLIIASGEYFAIAGDSMFFRAFPDLAADSHAIILTTLPALNNNGDSIIVRDPSGHVVDSLKYLPSWHSPGVVDVSGRSLEKLRPELASTTAFNWGTCVRVAGGTPARVNSILAPAVAGGTTLSMGPNPFSPDGDGWEDFLLVRYTLPGMSGAVTITVYDVLGRRIRRILNGQPAAYSGEVVWDGRDDQRRRVRMGIYILFLEALDEGGGTMLSAKAVAVVGGRL